MSVSKLLATRSWGRRIQRETREQPDGEARQECPACGLIRWKHKTKERCPRCGTALVTNETPGQCNPPVPTTKET